MILKIQRQKQIDSKEQGITELVTEYYESKNFKEQGCFMLFDDEKSKIRITDYEELTDDDCIIYYKTLSVYLMNNEGKTIERLI